MGRSKEGALIAMLLAGFVVVALWLVLQNKGPEDLYPPMSTYSPTPDGTKALFELSTHAGLQPARFHGTEYEYPEQSCMVVVDKQDFDWEVISGQTLDVNALRLWLEDGGRLVLFSTPLRPLGDDLFAELDQVEGMDSIYSSPWSAGSHSATPGWDRHATPQNVTGRRLTGRGGSGQVAALWRSYEPGQQFELPEDRPALWDDVEVFETASASMLAGINGHVLLASSSTADPVVIYRSFGAGELIWVPRPELAVNSWLDRVDNHRLVLALLAYASDGRPLYFDEHIHGYRQERANPVGMLTGTLGGRLLLALLGAVLLLFLGAAIRPARCHPQPVPPRRQAVEMVLAQADLYRRAGATRNVAGSLVDGVKRAWMQAFHTPAPPTDDMLAGWLDTGTAGALTLQRYLQSGNTLNASGLAALARDCDAVCRLLAHSSDD